MSLKVRWLVTDIDGTITDSQGRLDLAACEQLQRLEQSGIRVGLISGRPFPMVQMLGEYLGITGPLIAENGGVGLFPDRKRFELGSRIVTENAARQILSATPIHSTWDNDWRLTDFAIEPSASIPTIEALISRRNLDIELHISSIMIHLSKKGINKCVGLECCMTEAGLEHEEVIISGDAKSDLSLFEAFKRSIAPSNSCDAVVNKAGFCATSAFGKGFCEGLEYYRERGYLPH
jgi:phosphoglycolate phosphatase (TIGR01487 family)